jgi:hypothetical protein
LVSIYWLHLSLRFFETDPAKKFSVPRQARTKRQAAETPSRKQSGADFQVSRIAGFKTR